MNLNSPITARLTPAESEMPSDLIQHRSEIKRGVPHTLDITPTGLRVVLSVSTGLIRQLLKLSPEDVVLSSADQKLVREARGTVVDAIAETREHAAPRLLFITNDKFAAHCPLITGASVFIPVASQSNSAGTQIWVTSFALTVSALIGINATSSWIEFGWREIDKGTDNFDSVVLRPSLQGRVVFSRVVDGELQVIEVESDLLSPDSTAALNGGGLNWRLWHDGL